MEGSLLRKMTKSLKNYLVGGLIFTLLFAAGCSGGKETSQSGKQGGQGTTDSERMQLEVFVPTFTTEPPKPTSPVIEALQDYTDTDIKMIWVPNSNLDDKFNITLSSGDLPHIMYVPSKSPSFVSAVRDGAFWELGPYLQDYPNLSQANEIILNNSSVNGDIYGIYRSRDLGRNGVIIRKDWLENLELEEPKTIEDFYKMLKSFKEEDPDGNGKDDTYGMVVSKYEGPWDVMQTWFGVPNKWGENDKGELEPAFLHENYLEALNFFKKLYDEGLVNEDFAVMDPAQWSDPVVSGKAGVQVNVVDEGHRIQEKIIDADPDNEDPITVIGAVEGPTGLHNLPTSGYSGMLAVSKTKVKTEDELKKVLTFLDKLNDEEAQILAENGIEGKHYEIVDGEMENLTKDDPGLLSELDGLNQMLMYLPEAKSLTPKTTPLRELEEEVKLANEEIVVPNPSEAFISEVYSKKGTQLDNIIQDARIKYIVGQIDESGLDEVVELWKKSGGNDYLEEINKLYKEVNK